MGLCVQYCVVIFAIFTVSRCHLRTDNDYWTHLAHQELAEALQVQWNTNVAKNIVLFVGDAMDPNTITATRIYKGGESHRLVYETFPHVGLLKTYSADHMTPDSASTATAMFCGLKVNQHTVGVAAAVQRGDCNASLLLDSRLHSLAVLAQEAGMSTGLVTTMRVTHATPAPLFAHSADRRWECEAEMPAAARARCKDIARQLVEDSPGRDFNVIMGGGRQVLVSNSTGTPADPLDTWSCISKDGRNLIQDYKKDKENRGLKYSYVTNNKELSEFDIENTDYLLGIFANGHMKLEYERDRGPGGMPSISDMVEAALKVLQKNSKGYFLMVEGGNIDMSHHRGHARKAVDEAAAMEDAVKVAATMTSEEDTLLIVTSDHGHTLTINGFAKRGSDIFGVIEQRAEDGPGYTTLTYGTGGPGSYRCHPGDSALPNRDTRAFSYRQVAAAPAFENLHGGGDVTIYARGPFSHLVSGVHEQHYVYWAVSHAAQLAARSAGHAHPLLAPSLACAALLLLFV